MLTHLNLHGCLNTNSGAKFDDTATIHPCFIEWPQRVAQRVLPWTTREIAPVFAHARRKPRHTAAVVARTLARLSASSKHVARCCAGLVLSAVLALGSNAAAESRRRGDLPFAEDPSKGEAVLLGSSSMNQSLGRIIAGELERRGYRVLRKGVSAAGLARPDFRDMNEVLDELPISPDTAAVFIYLGMNDAQSLWLHQNERDLFGRGEYLPWSDDRWDELYVQRATHFFERICERGAQRAIVLLPVDVQRERLQQRLERIRTLQAQAASSSSCAVALTTGGDFGHFEVEGVSMRARDGFHMSVTGAHAVWRRIQADAMRLIGAREPMYDPHDSGCIASCRLGQGLLFRPEKRTVMTEFLASDVMGMVPPPRCTSW